MRTFREFLEMMDGGQPMSVDPIGEISKRLRYIPDVQNYIKSFMSGYEVPADILKKIDDGLRIYADNMPAGAARLDRPGSLLKWVVQNFAQASQGGQMAANRELQGRDDFQQTGGSFQQAPAPAAQAQAPGYATTAGGKGAPFWGAGSGFWKNRRGG